MADWRFQYRRLATALVLAAAFAEGLASSSSAMVRAAIAVTTPSALILWCGLDARIHGKLFLRAFVLPMFLTWPVGFAVHLIWTRGAKGVLTYALFAIAAMCAAGAGLGIEALATGR